MAARQMPMKLAPGTWTKPLSAFPIFELEADRPLAANYGHLRRVSQFNWPRFAGVVNYSRYVPTPRVQRFALFVRILIALIRDRDSRLSPVLYGLDPLARNAKALQTGCNRSP